MRFLGYAKVLLGSRDYAYGRLLPPSLFPRLRFRRRRASPHDSGCVGNRRDGCPRPSLLIGFIIFRASSESGRDCYSVSVDASRIRYGVIVGTFYTLRNGGSFASFVVFFFWHMAGLGLCASVFFIGIYLIAHRNYPPSGGAFWRGFRA